MKEGKEGRRKSREAEQKGWGKGHGGKVKVEGGEKSKKTVMLKVGGSKR